MESFLRDVNFALRSLKRQPAFAITAVLTVALGIGATSAIFSVVNAVLLRPLPYSDAARLGTVWSDLRNRNVKDFPLPPGDFFDLRKDTTQFDGFAAITSFRPTIGGDGPPHVVAPIPQRCAPQDAEDLPEDLLTTGKKAIR